jgi:hypothetical protein
MPIEVPGNGVWSRYSNSLTQRALALSAQQETDPRVTSGCNIAKVFVNVLFRFKNRVRQVATIPKSQRFKQVAYLYYTNRVADLVIHRRPS